MKFKLPLLSALLTCVLIYGCSTKLYEEDNRYEAGTLSPVQLDSLHTFLKQNTRTAFKDTVMIKYDFNKDVCWHDLDWQNPEFLNGVRWDFQQNIINKAKQRPQIAIYQYRETGENFSPIKSKGLEIETDSGFLRKMIFREKTTCGTAAIVLPDGKYLLVKSDAQFSALLLNNKDIDRLVLQNLVKIPK